MIFNFLLQYFICAIKIFNKLIYDVKVLEPMKIKNDIYINVKPFQYIKSVIIDDHNEVNKENVLTKEITVYLKKFEVSVPKKSYIPDSYFLISLNLHTILIDFITKNNLNHLKIFKSKYLKIEYDIFFAKRNFNLNSNQNNLICISNNSFKENQSIIMTSEMLEKFNITCINDKKPFHQSISIGPMDNQLIIYKLNNN